MWAALPGTGPIGDLARSARSSRFRSGAEPARASTRAAPAHAGTRRRAQSRPGESRDRRHSARPGSGAFALYRAVDGQIGDVHALRTPLARGDLHQRAQPVLDRAQRREAVLGAHARRRPDLQERPRTLRQQLRADRLQQIPGPAQVAAIALVDLLVGDLDQRPARRSARPRSARRCTGRCVRSPRPATRATPDRSGRRPRRHRARPRASTSAATRSTSALVRAAAITCQPWAAKCSAIARPSDPHAHHHQRRRLGSRAIVVIASERVPRNQNCMWKPTELGPRTTCPACASP